MCWSIFIVLHCTQANYWFCQVLVNVHIKMLKFELLNEKTLWNKRDFIKQETGRGNYKENNNTNIKKYVEGFKTFLLLKT